MAARAMCNFGLDDLRLVAPRDGWSPAKAAAAAAGGAAVFHQSRIFSTLEEAMADLDFVLATTARPRDMNKQVHTPVAAVVKLSEAKRAGVLFGPESSGLGNDALSLCDGIIEIPTSPDFSSLNLAQAVLCVSYEFFRAHKNETATKEEKPTVAPKNELVHLFAHLEGELEAAAFFRPKDKRPIMVRNLRNIFHRAALTSSEVKALRGVIAALVALGKNKRT